MSRLQRHTAATVAFCSCLCAAISASSAQPPGASGRITAYAQAHDFNGSILVEKHGTIVYQHSFGVADRAFGVPVRDDTRYRIASITKTFTAVLILQLVEAGKLDLHATIKTYLPQYAGEGADRVTLDQLLHHTSGIQNSDTIKTYQAAVEHGIDMYQLPHSTDELLARYASGRIVREVGKVFEYNNADFIILGKIIETVSGKPFAQVLQDRILRPLQMRNSGIALQHQILTHLAFTYFRPPDSKELINDLPVYFENWYAAGAMYSTTGDLLLFARALYGNRLLKAETLQQMLTPGLDNYGYGLWVFDLEIESLKHRVAYRPGSIMGANAAFYRILDSGVTIIVLSNTNMTNLDEFSPFIARAVLSRKSRDSR